MARREFEEETGHHLASVELSAGSGRLVGAPEIDRVAWFEPAAARASSKASQVVFIDRLAARLAEEG